MSEVAARVRQRLQRAAFWSVSARILGIGLNVLVSMVLARALSPRDFGSFAVVSSVVAFISVVALLGMHETSVRYIASELALGGADRGRAAARVAFRFAGASIPLVAAAAAGIIWLVHPWFHWTSSEALRLSLLVAAGGGLLAWQQLGADALRGFHELRWASLFSGGQAGGPVCLAVFVGLLLLISWQRSLRLEGALALHVLSIAAMVPVTWACLRWTMRRAAPPDSPVAEHRAPPAADMLRMGVTLMLIQVLAFFTQQADLWIGGALLPAEELGLYQASRRIVMLIAIPVQLSLITLASSIAELRARGEQAQLQAILRSAALVAALPSFLALGFVSLFARPALTLVFGEFYSQAQVPLLILCAGHFFLVACGNPVHVLNIGGGHGYSLWLNVASTLALLGLAPPLTRMYGMNGLAAASAVSFAAQNVCGWWLVHKIVGVWTHVGWRRWKPEADRTPPSFSAISESTSP